MGYLPFLAEPNEYWPGTISVFSGERPPPDRDGRTF